MAEMLGSNRKSEMLMKFARAVWELLSVAAVLSDFFNHFILSDVGL